MKPITYRIETEEVQQVRGLAEGQLGQISADHFNDELEEVDRWMGLAAAVVLQALEDLDSPDMECYARACTWLLGPGLIWCRVLGIQRERVVSRVQSALLNF